ncbi:class I SAM-dependent methyltransferase [Luteolibacter luteus]|uniref:Class I SAM-dependent methyltransferase n=1 Tax=Luteolibacter luteus TaxID=2728835 RepID=A0A858RKP3_9BACT|nr:CmcI family methyltransferase [Luteolibacter luteus]QJE96959.1 class I SAM-dependent methyltransferase [Luteolibacter luteus]
MSLSRQVQRWIKGIAYHCGFSLRRLRSAKANVSTGGDFAGKVRPLLHKVDPYQGFDWQSLPDDRSGWGSDSTAFGELVAAIKPRRIIEVGTWKGGSALTLAEALEKQGLDAEIICVDTWLGALEMWTDQEDAGRFGSLALKHGYPTLYYQFLANVCRAGQQTRITPFPIPSVTAAQWFSLRDVRADLIYIDGSHEEDDVYQDLVSYWDLVRPGGVLFGDDWSWDGVRLAVERFARENSLPITHRHDKWELKRPA